MQCLWPGLKPGALETEKMRPPRLPPYTYMYILLKGMKSVLTICCDRDKVLSNATLLLNCAIVKENYHPEAVRKNKIPQSFHGHNKR